MIYFCHFPKEDVGLKYAAFYTLGCKVNQYETQAIAGMFLKAGYERTEFDRYADIYVINTCSVTALAEKKSMQIIRRAKMNNPLAIVVVTGCFAQVSPDKVSAIAGVDIVVGNSSKQEIVRIVEEFGGEPVRYIAELGAEYAGLSAHTGSGRTRAFMKVQDGCNNFCAYCIIPYARGRNRSRAMEDIIEEAKVLSAAGFKEIVLTGIHLASYGGEVGDRDLLDIVRNLHKIEGIERIRLGSLELTHIVQDIAKDMAQLPRLCPHFHISLQSGCDATLKRMNRKYTARQYEEAVFALKTAAPHMAITTDMMVGFPGETVQEFEASRAFAEAIGFAKMHIFPYSKRPGTVAADMEGQISAQEKKSRAKLMQQTADVAAARFAGGLVGTVQSVLFEQYHEGGICEGHAANYMPVRMQCKEDEEIRKKILPIRITGYVDGFLIGEK